MMRDIAQLQEIARTWWGTPFRTDCCVKGRGVDCKLLAAAIVCEWLGLPVPAEGWLSKDVFRYRDDGVILGKLEKYFVQEQGLYVRGEPPVMPGDLLGFRRGRVGHVGVAVAENRVLHVMREGGVLEEAISDLVLRMPLCHVYHLRGGK